MDQVAIPSSYETHLSSSKGPGAGHPELFTTTSTRRYKLSALAATSWMRSNGLVTSSSRTSAPCALRCWIESTLREVAMTLSPRLRASKTICVPSPPEHPYTVRYTDSINNHDRFEQHWSIRTVTNQTRYGSRCSALALESPIEM